jgi:hypothetical protein
MCEICNAMKETESNVTYSLVSFDQNYDKTVESLANYALEVTKKLVGEPLFRVNTKESLFDVYLNMFPEETIVRQCFNCNACRSFLHRYGNLVYVNDEGRIKSIIWDEDHAYGEFKSIVKKLRQTVESGNISMVLSSANNTNVEVYDKHSRYGIDYAGNDYYHLHANISNNILKPEYGTTSDECVQIFKTVRVVLNRYRNVIDRAIAITSTGELNNKNTLDKLNCAKAAMNDIYNTEGKRLQENKIWKYAFKNYTILYHLAGSVEGALMDDILSGVSDEDAIASFNKKMDPLTYKRPSSAPTAQLVKEAEKIINELNLESALDRRIASINDIPEFIWKKPENKSSKDKSKGIFANVKTKEDIENEAKEDLVTIDSLVHISFEKFVEKVLPTAVNITISLPEWKKFQFASFVTAKDPDAEPLMRWDTKERRNPLNHYLYYGGSYPSDWAINNTGNVIAICYNSECIHNQNTDEFGLFILEGCRDTQLAGGSALFPEDLRKELYPVRKVIESFSKDKKLEDIDPNEQAAAGIAYYGNNMELYVIVETETTRMKYVIDRFE